MPQVSDEVIFIALILGIAISILIVLFAAVVLLHHYEHRRNEKLTLSSLVGTITDFFPKARPKEEATLSPPDTIVVQTAPEATLTNKSKEEITSGQKVIKASWWEPTHIAAEVIRLTSFIAGLINGAWVIIIAAPYYGEYSPYYGLVQIIPSPLVPLVGCLFGSGFQFVLASLSGASLGAAIGWLSTHLFKTPNSFVKDTGLVGGVGGLLSIGILFLNIYAS